MKKKILLVLVILTLVLTGCKSLFTREGNLLGDAKRAGKRGNYQTAVLNVVESVRIDNEYAKAIAYLKEIYPKANSYYSQKIEEKKTSTDLFKNDQIVDYYSYLYSINEAVKTLPALIDPKTKAQLYFEYTNYKPELDQYLQLAAEDHYQEGLRFIRLRGRENAKSAAKEFETALSFVTDYRDAKQRAMEAMEEGTQVVAFFQFVNNAWNIPTDTFSELLQNSAISTLMSDKEVMKFTKIIDRDMQSRLIEEQMGSLNALMDDKSRVEIGQLLNANIFITGTIDSAFLNGPSTSINKQLRSTTIEPDEGAEESSSTKEDTADQAFYKKDNSSTVYADVFYYTKEINFGVTISYKAVDVESGAILLSSTLSVMENDSTEWMEWTGDERALSAEDYSMQGSFETNLKSAEQLANDAAKQIGIEFAEELADILK